MENIGKRILTCGPQQLLEPCSLCCPTIKDVQCHISIPQAGGGRLAGWGVSIKRRKEWFVKTGTIYITLLSVQFQTTVAVGYRSDHGSQGTTHCDSELLPPREAQTRSTT